MSKRVRNKGQRSGERRRMESETFFQPSRTALPNRRRAARRQCVCYPAKVSLWQLEGILWLPRWVTPWSQGEASTAALAQKLIKAILGWMGSMVMIAQPGQLLLFRILFSLSFSSVPYNYSNKEEGEEEEHRYILFLVLKSMAATSSAFQ